MITMADKEKLMKKEDHKETRKIEEKQALPALTTGLTVKVYEKITEGEKERIQIFEGIIIAIKGKTSDTKTMTIRKVASGVGVEKIFPFASPLLIKVEIVKKAKVSRAKLYYLKDYKKKLKEVVVK